MMEIQPWLEFGWPVALLVLVLSGIGIGFGIFLRNYLEQQKTEFNERQKNTEAKNALIQEQHIFIRTLAENAMNDMRSYMEGYNRLVTALKEITKSLASLNAAYQQHVVMSDNKLSTLQDGHNDICVELRHIERATIMHKEGNTNA
jgi:uncharacterized protein HemX